MTLTTYDIIIRLALGFLAGAVIGFERSSRQQTAGLKTHILIAIGATLLMLLSIWLPAREGLSGDTGRIAAQVVSGIGFLGAGAMIKLGNTIKGLTTAASLWMTAAMGLAIGAGMYLACGVATILALFTLIVIRRFEKRLFPSARNKTLTLTYNSRAPQTEDALAVLKTFRIKVHSVDVREFGHDSTRLHMLISIPDRTDVSKLARALKTAGKVINLELKENY
jgi:putative Mg2+ transporter-C (MgtC) family protein